MQTEKRGEVSVIRPTGRIDSATASAFDRTVNEVFDSGARWVVLDMSQLEYISSAGLRGVLIAGKKARALPGGKLVLCALREQIREVFEISGFLAIFAITADLDAALRQFE
ncbi:STAS domain-containing protein [Pseudothauera rhizosphaerae]|uniref:Anti-sigma factor antagonist n=1 Tax=Pseudothauera rhizosphaerae TaxID=2565932 RepID=A0A4S4ADY0_9RHOO|nr:STAS domain-containing protein [Pseudothauera rhizosphaerae]